MFSKLDLKNHPITTKDLEAILAEVARREGSATLHDVMLNLIQRAVVGAVITNLGNSDLDNSYFRLGAAMACCIASEVAIDLLQEDGVDVFDPNNDVLSVYKELSELGLKAAQKSPDDDGALGI